MSSFAATMLCDAMQRIPGNRDFGRRFEFATTVEHFYGRRAYIIFQVWLESCVFGCGMDGCEGLKMR